ncbi:PucR family transcriptional regulator [Nocardia stercoris]|uniref:PucR family transcriptional regulator n=1 Tax=Nocardia stercoris TaxID=2483361 RepID=A0A3M2L1N9_9NOCA|nr:helix-turn-helix domain-containing protein [Nocardia stercoris]RMI31491.1 PucR family transcriptional regulator [Nocardia stercoris]
MVQDAARPVSWPTPGPDVLALLRQAAELVLAAPAQWLEQLHEASFAGERMRPVAEDPALAAAVRRVNEANVRHWANANVSDPGRRVPPNVGPEALSAARDLVRRGLDESSLDAYRTSYTVVWKYLMDICFTLTDDHRQLRELLELAALSVSTFIEDTVSAVTARMQTERADLVGGTHAERRATVSLLLEGAPIRRSQAESQLGYRLTGPHTAAVVWAPTPSAAGNLETAAELLMEAGGAVHRLTIVASAAALWLWLPVDAAIDPEPVTAGLAAIPGVQVAVGRPGVDLDGFRRSHLDALETQRMLARIPARRLARYEDIQLVSVLAADPIRAREFVADTLGALAQAEPEVIEAVTVYLETQCSTTRTAARLYTHRNTVVRRLTRADELLPRPLAANVIAVGAALEALRWFR